jgi:UDP-glucose 4-epimerase
VARAEDKTGTRMRRALVRGGAGFVGSHLCERLLSEGYRVLCMDNLRTSSLAAVCWSGICGLGSIEIGALSAP